jgi:hypothetical protein
VGGQRFRGPLLPPLPQPPPLPVRLQGGDLIDLSAPAGTYRARPFCTPL